MKISARKKIILFITILFTSLVLYNIDIITGYWNLYALCELDAGSRIYEPL